MDRNVDGLVRDTFHSGLRLAELSLMAMGVPEAEAARGVAIFRARDEAYLFESHAIYRDEARLLQSAAQEVEELTALLEADRQRQGTADAI